MTEHGPHARVEAALRGAVKSEFDVELGDVASSRPPKGSLGDAAFPVAFDLARKARMAPRKIAETLAPILERVDGVARVDVAGAGYLNVFFDRAGFVAELLGASGKTAETRKVIVEHTNINPNKAAHIGHLRNAALGDTFVRVLRHRGANVEVQNYIDDTGVQVADVVVGFLHLEGQTLDDVQALAAKGKFDYACWDLYARVSEFYEESRERKTLREDTLKAIEEGHEPEASMGAFIADEIVRYHLATMDRIDVRYDLLPAESDILKLRFWERAYELLKERGAIRLSESGKNQGCWVMDVVTGPEAEATEEDEKVIVRSNGTVTYVGKDIAYQMWKLGLLDRQFGYTHFESYGDGTTVWATTSGESRDDAPGFGRGDVVYNVIDVRQAYLQDIVQRGVALLAGDEARERSHHFSYEMVALTPATCRELGFPVSAEDEDKPYLEVSGRKGLGVKADDLLEALKRKALEEVQKRNEELDEADQRAIANDIARGALRYFMVRTTKNRVIAFDFAEALSFDGDSGPYLQYAAVRATKILQKMEAPLEIDAAPPELADWLSTLDAEEADELWALIFQAAELDSVTQAVVRTEEPAHLTRYALNLAQRFNGFYHRYHIAREEDPVRRSLRLLAVQLFLSHFRTALGLVGVPVPERM